MAAYYENPRCNHENPTQTSSSRRCCRAERAAAPAPHKTLKGLVRRNLMLKHLGDMAQQSKVGLHLRGLAGWLC